MNSYNLADELSLEDGIFLWGSRVIVYPQVCDRVTEETQRSSYWDSQKSLTCQFFGGPKSILICKRLQHLSNVQEQTITNNATSLGMAQTTLKQNTCRLCRSLSSILF